MNPSREFRIVVYPGYGYVTTAGDVLIRVSGVVYEHRRPLNMRKQFLVNMLARAMRATPDETSDETFRRRVAPFVARASHGQRVWLQVGPRRFRLRRRTRRSGWFRVKLRLSRELLDQLRTSGELVDDRITIRAWLSADDHIESVGSVFVLPEQGSSVVSDIDDTIKETNVGNRRELLANTFLREFRCIEGMAELFRQWAAKGASFHYVSSSPWQLFDPINQWTVDGGFPPGTLHLRTFRLRDQVIRRKASARRRKSQSIAKMMKVFPQRKFILIGDSGELDPEIYGKLFRKYSDRIAAVFIRDLAGHRLGIKRFAQMKAQCGPKPCELFSTADDLRKLTSELF